MNYSVLNIKLIYCGTERSIEIAALQSVHYRMILKPVGFQHYEAAEAIGRIVRIIGCQRENTLAFSQHIVYGLHAVVKLMSHAEATIVGKLYSPYALKPDIILISLNGPERMVI